MRLRTLFSEIGRDLAYGWRGLRRSPVFSITAITLLSVGIGVNLAEFAAFRQLFHPVALPHPESLYRLDRIFPGSTGYFPRASVEYYRAHVPGLSALLAVTSNGVVTPDGDSTPLRKFFVSASYLPTLGANPLLGRLLDAHDSQGGAEPVAVMSYSYWDRHYQKQRSAVNQIIYLNHKPVRMVGVLPASFTGFQSDAPDVWLPLELQPYLLEGRQAISELRIYGRARPGVTPHAIEAEFRSAAAGLAIADPQLVQADEAVSAQPLGGGMETKVDSQDLAILGMFLLLVLFVLITACANLGNMILARGMDRKPEIRTRMALGASRGRLVRQLMTENLLLAGISSAFALGVSWLASGWISLLTGASISATVDAGTAAVCIGLGIFSTVAIGLVPAWQTTRPTPRVKRFRKLLIGAQATLCCTLLILGCLLTKGVSERAGARRQSEQAHFLVARFPHTTAAVPRTTLDTAIERVRRVPGVSAVTMNTFCNEYQADRSKVMVCLGETDPSYFQTMRLAVVQGRTFRDDDRDVVMISQSGARSLYPGQEAVGKLLRVPVSLTSGDESWRDSTVIGVFEDDGLHRDQKWIEAYRPLKGETVGQPRILIRTRGEPKDVLAATSLAASSPDLEPAVEPLLALFDWRSNWITNEVVIVDVLGGLATLIAAVGLIGLVAYSVSRQVREIGIRLAIGASAVDILRSVLSQYVRPILVGAVLSLPGAAWFALNIRGSLFGVSSFDPLAYLGALLLFVAISLISALVPAVRALGIEPAAALRSD